MDMYLKKLLKLAEKINKMPYSVEKLRYYQDFMRFSTYISLAFDIDEKSLHNLIAEDEYCLKKYDNYETKINENLYNSLSDSEKLGFYLEDLINYFDPNKIFIGDTTRINNENFDEIIPEFFLFLGNDIYKHYMALKKKKYIIVKKDYADLSGQTFPLYHDLSPIICNNYDSFEDYLTLVHEIGHSYHFSFSRNLSYGSNISWFCEIPSILFENLFVNYVKDNKILDGKTLKKIEYRFLVSAIIQFKSSYLSDKANYHLSRKNYIDYYNDEVLPNIDTLDADEYSKTYSIGYMTAFYLEKFFKEDNISFMKDFKSMMMLLNDVPVDSLLNDNFVIATKNKLKTLSK